MSDQLGSGPKVRDLTVEDVARGLKEGRVVLVDVREPNETAVERFPGAVLAPLSAFDPATIAAPPGAEVVFACRSGRRSVTASVAAQEQGFEYDGNPALGRRRGSCPNAIGGEERGFIAPCLCATERSGRSQ